MVCGPADGPDSHRYVFGFLDEGRAIQYTGPSAVGQGTADGAFLFALSPGSLGTQGSITVGPVKDAGGAGVGFPGNAFALAITDGVRQPSGCYIQLTLAPILVVAGDVDDELGGAPGPPADPDIALAGHRRA